MPQWSYVGETTPQLPSCRGRRWRHNTLTDRETQVPSEGATPGVMGVSDTRPPLADTFRVTEIPRFNPSIPPPERTDCESGRPPAPPTTRDLPKIPDTGEGTQETGNKKGRKGTDMDHHRVRTRRRQTHTNPSNHRDKRSQPNTVWHMRHP